MKYHKCVCGYRCISGQMLEYHQRFCQKFKESVRA